MAYKNLPFNWCDMMTNWNGMTIIQEVIFFKSGKKKKGQQLNKIIISEFCSATIGYKLSHLNSVLASASNSKTMSLVLIY